MCAEWGSSAEAFGTAPRSSVARPHHRFLDGGQTPANCGTAHSCSRSCPTTGLRWRPDRSFLRLLESTLHPPGSLVSDRLVGEEAVQLLGLIAPEFGEAAVAPTSPFDEGQSGIERNLDCVA